MVFAIQFCHPVCNALLDNDPDQPSVAPNNLDQKPREKGRVNAYSSSSAKANEFLSYEKCMQRMKCPINRKEDCREECQAGNTEEEVEEHTELIVNERRRSFKRAPKSKFETPTIKKHAEKDPSTLGKTQESNSSSLKKTEL